MIKHGKQEHIKQVAVVDELNEDDVEQIMDELGVQGLNVDDCNTAEVITALFLHNCAFPD